MSKANTMYNVNPTMIVAIWGRGWGSRLETIVRDHNIKKIYIIFESMCSLLLGELNPGRCSYPLVTIFDYCFYDYDYFYDYLPGEHTIEQNWEEYARAPRGHTE